MRFLMFSVVCLVACAARDTRVELGCNDHGDYCSCTNNFEVGNDNACNAAQFASGYCCASTGWPEDVGEGSCICRQVSCKHYIFGDCRCDSTEIPDYASAIDTCYAGTNRCCLDPRFGTCRCSPDEACDRGVIVPVCSVDTLANFCEPGESSRVESCSVEPG